MASGSRWTLNPGPMNSELLFLGSKHRSYQKFSNEDATEVLTVRRGDQRLWDYLSHNYLHPRVSELINDAGFGGVISCGYRTVNRSLIHALVERWRPETHSFHLPFGEVTVTLQDVNILYGLPIEGYVVSGLDDPASNKAFYINVCTTMLGFLPVEDDFRGSRINASCVYDALEAGFPDEPTELECHQRARLILFILCGCVLFPDTSNARIPMYLACHFTDLTRVQGLSWGSAVLACLYRNLCKSCLTGVKEIAGPCYLLQLWAWERFICFSPAICQPGGFLGGAPLGARWANRLSYEDTVRHSVRTFRSTLQSMTEDQFSWQPYFPFIAILPPQCFSGAQSWLCNCCLIFWEVVEHYAPDRVLRQFGMLQIIPPPLPISKGDHQTLHNLTRGGKTTRRSWFDKHQAYIETWDNRAQNRFEGVQTMVPTVAPGYMSWYLERTVLYLSDPGMAPTVTRGLRNDGARLQLMGDCLSQVYNEASQGNLESSSAQQPHLQHVHDSVEQLFGYVQQPQQMRLYI